MRLFVSLLSTIVPVTFVDLAYHAGAMCSIGPHRYVAIILPLSSCVVKGMIKLYELQPVGPIWGAVDETCSDQHRHRQPGCPGRPKTAGRYALLIFGATCRLREAPNLVVGDSRVLTRGGQETNN